MGLLILAKPFAHGIKNYYNPYPDEVHNSKGVSFLRNNKIGKHVRPFIYPFRKLMPPHKEENHAEEVNEEEMQNVI